MKMGPEVKRATLETISSIASKYIVIFMDYSRAAYNSYLIYPAGNDLSMFSSRFVHYRRAALDAFLF